MTALEGTWACETVAVGLSLTTTVGHGVYGIKGGAVAWKQLLTSATMAAAMFSGMLRPTVSVP